MSFNLGSGLLSSLLYFLYVQHLPFLTLDQSIVRYGKQHAKKKHRLRKNQITAFLNNTDTEVSGGTGCWNRDPPAWPESLIVVQRRVPDLDSRVGPARTVTYYNHPLGANLIQITPLSNDNDGQEEVVSGDVLWDLELNSGHSYYFTPSQKTCKAIDFPVGILRPNWLEGATPLGPSPSWDGSGRIVCGWTKVDFIDYYADYHTGIPDSWYFHTMKATFQVLEYTANPEERKMDPSLFIPPDYCFANNNNNDLQGRL